MGHVLVPEHTILSEAESQELLKKYKIRPDQLPKILHTDPGVVAIGARPGQIIKIVRKSQTAKQAIVYRFIIESEGGVSPDIVPADISMDIGSDSVDV